MYTCKSILDMFDHSTKKINIGLCVLSVGLIFHEAHNYIKSLCLANHCAFHKVWKIASHSCPDVWIGLLIMSAVVIWTFLWYDNILQLVDNFLYWKQFLKDGLTVI